MEQWRLLISSPQNGRLNMSQDEAILACVTSGHSLPTLRLYAWDPGCLSLGYAQHCSDIDLTALNSHGWDYVRRPTGGRAILHIDEITYSVCAPFTCSAVCGSLLESYRRLSRGLLRALEILGLQASADKEYDPSELAASHPICFEVPSNYEITALGKKLIGSAQSRKSGGVLQHGTLPLTGDIARINDVLSYPVEFARAQARERIYLHAVTLETVLGRVVSWSEAADAMTNGFASALQIDLIKAKLSEEEVELAQNLLHSKYDTTEWNDR
jgi:lipoyl(octanoyl) transferase